MADHDQQTWSRGDGIVEPVPGVQVKVVRRLVQQDDVRPQARARSSTSGTGQPPAAHAALPGEEPFEQVRVELPVSRVDVESDRVPAGVADRVRGRDEHPGGHDHVIPGWTPASRYTMCKAAVPLHVTTASRTPATSAAPASNLARNSPAGRPGRPRWPGPAFPRNTKSRAALLGGLAPDDVHSYKIPVRVEVRPR